MSAGWVAATVRAKALLSRRAGRAVSQEIAQQPTLAAALALLAKTGYRRFLPENASVTEAERAVSRAVVWNLRVLGGWLPRAGTSVFRVLVADFETANVADRLRVLGEDGAATSAPYRLGALATAGDRVSAAASADELRHLLAASAWGDPGTADPADVIDYLRVRSASRLAELSAVTEKWGAAATALAIARQQFLIGRTPTVATAKRARPLIGTAALTAADWRGFVSGLPSRTAGWVFEEIDGPQRLWLAELNWWSRVEKDATDLARSASYDMAPSLGCATLLLADAHAVRHAIGAAARGGDLSEAQFPSTDLPGGEPVDGDDVGR